MRQNGFLQFNPVIISVIFLMWLMPSVQAQNGPSLFKLSYQVTEDDPKWIQLMYSDNPNVWEVEREYNRYYSKNKFIKSTHTQNYKYWRKNIYKNDFITNDGYIRVPSLDEQLRSSDIKEKEWKSKGRVGKMNANWTPMGPFETFWADDGNVKMSSQVNIYSIDQSASNPNIMFCGTETSSVFKSTDKAQNWISKTDGLVFTGGVHAVKIHPTDPNIVFFGTQSAIYKSVNGGDNWEMVYSEAGMNVNTILIVPGTLPSDPYIVMATGGSVAAGAGGVFRSADEGKTGTWVKQSNEAGWDLKLKPGSNDIVYLLRSKATDQMVKFFRSSNKGLTFTEQSTGWFAGSSANIDNTNSGARMAVTAANPEYVYVALLGDDVSRAQDVFWIGVYKSTNGGTSWTLPSGDPGGPYSPTHYNLSGFHPFNIQAGPTPYQQEYYNLGIGVSATDPERVMVGCLNLFQSTDGAATYQAIGGYVNDVGYTGYRHPDIQEIEINGADIWVANDGGIDKFSADWLSHESLNKGINGSEYWGFDTGWNEDVLVGGRYHNGNSVLYQNYPSGQARDMGGAESGTGYINKGENRRVHTSDSQDRLMPTAITGTLTAIPNLGIYPSETNGDPSNAGEVEPDPRCYNHMYLTRDNILYKSTDAGASFNPLFTFGNDPMLRATRIEVSRSNPQVLYVCQKLAGSSVIHKSTNGGVTFTPINLPTTNGNAINSAAGFLISLSPTNENELYVGVANGGFSQEKVFITRNGGTTWQNLTSATLDGHRIEQIMHQAGTNEGVYVATNSSVFYRNSSHGDWQNFSAGSPAAFRSGILRPFYKESKIRLATENRGIWSSPLFENSAPLAQPTASTLQSSCNLDTVYFEDFSILNHTNASWAWSFSPAPAYVSSTTVRNPKVVFGAVGSYDVTLTITNGAGQSDTKTITNMVTTGNTCFCAPCNGCSNSYSTVGSATIDIPNCCIDLTPNTPGNQGATWHSEPINLNNSFEVKFDADFGNIDGTDADGIAFVLQKVGATALGSGQGVGNTAINPSLSVVFKTWVNDRIEIWEDGIDNNLAATSPAISGGAGTHPITIKWDATAKSLTVDWQNNGVDLTYNNDIIASIFSGDGSGVIWGFTARTGGLSANHKVCNMMLDVTAGPCPPNVTVSMNPTGNTLASSTISTQGDINASGALFSAPNVNLNTGFSVAGNQCFEVNNVGCLYNGILNCDGNTPPNGTCAAPFVLTCGTPYNGNTANGMSTWNSYANGAEDYGGPETIHTITVPANQARTINLASAEDVDLFVVEACSNTTLIASGVNDGNESVALPINANNKTYFLIVERWAGGTAAYTLNCN